MLWLRTARSFGLTRACPIATAHRRSLPRTARNSGCSTASCIVTTDRRLLGRAVRRFGAVMAFCTAMAGPPSLRPQAAGAGGSRASPIALMCLWSIAAAASNNGDATASRGRAKRLLSGAQCPAFLLTPRRHTSPNRFLPPMRKGRQQPPCWRFLLGYRPAFFRSASFASTTAFASAALCLPPSAMAASSV